MGGLSLRVMTEGDLAAVDELRRLAGWNQTPEDWRRLLELEPQGCFLAELDNELAGTVTTTAYGQAVAWIGMMLVHPKHRRQGIATLMMRQAIEYLRRRAVRLIGLDATPAGYPLYEKLGFVPEWTLTRSLNPNPNLNQTQPPPPAAASSETRELADADWDAVEQIDAGGLWSAALGPAAQPGPPQREGPGLARRTACRGLGPAPCRRQRGLPGSRDLPQPRRSHCAGHRLAARNGDSARDMGRS